MKKPLLLCAGRHWLKKEQEKRTERAEGCRGMRVLREESEEEKTKNSGMKRRTTVLYTISQEPKRQKQISIEGIVASSKGYNYWTTISIMTFSTPIVSLCSAASQGF